MLATEPVTPPIILEDFEAARVQLEYISMVKKSSLTKTNKLVFINY